MTGLEATKRIKQISDLSYSSNLEHEYVYYLTNIIESELKALEIIKTKYVDIGWLIKSKNCSKYNLGVGESQALKKTEYDLLKEVLK